MRVELEFMAQDQRYKVTRIYGRSNQSSTGKTELNLSVLSGTDYSSLMGNTIRDTEAIIIDLVKIDMELIEESISLLRLMAADEVWITSSLRGVIPVTAVDGQPIHANVIGETIKIIHQRYKNTIRSLE